MDDLLVRQMSSQDAPHVKILKIISRNTMQTIFSTFRLIKLIIIELIKNYLEGSFMLFKEYKIKYLLYIF